MAKTATSLSKKISISVLLLVLLSTLATAAFYKQMQTSKGQMHPIFTALKLITPTDATAQAVAAITSAAPAGLKLLREEVAKFYLIAADLPFNGTIEHRELPRPGYTLDVAIYTPHNANDNDTTNTSAKPVIVYYHGGGFNTGNIHMLKAFAQRLASITDAVVITPQYRLAPEHPYPAALEDTYAALQWVNTQAHDNPNWDVNRIIIAGDSAGGNLAAATALYSRDHQGPKLAGQILIYPHLLPFNQKYDAQMQAINFQPNAQLLSSFSRAYIGTAKEDDIYLSPGIAKNLNGLPPTLIITAGFDLLTPQANTFAQNLQSQNIATTVLHYPAVVHGFISMVGLLSETDDALNGIKGFIRL